MDNNLDNKKVAPDLSKGSFPFPHFGDIIHAGQPFGVLQLQEFINLKVNIINSSNFSYKSSDMPIPPRYAS